MTESKGYIKIDRKIMNNWLWNDNQFCRGAAWIDLLLNAHFEKGSFQSKKGQINYNRGDCTYSISDLAKRWNWSRWKVRSFLDALEENGMIKRKMAKEKYAIITILNYSKYQDNAKKTSTHSGLDKTTREALKELGAIK